MMARPNHVEYFFPSSTDHCLELLQQYGDRARLIAGGTDLLLLLERQQFHPAALIDITRISALQRLEVNAERAEIGSAVTYHQLLACPALCEGVPFLADAIRQIGGVQIRNVATLAGNVTNASPAGDTLPALYVLGARVHIEGPRGSRKLPIDEFVLGVRSIALAPGEIVTHISFGMPEHEWCGVFQKLGLRQAMAIAVVNAVALLCFEGAHVVDARLALGAVAPTVIRVPEAEELLAGSLLDGAVVEKAAALASAAARPIDDVRASALYRKHAVRGLVRRSLLDLKNRARVGE